MNEAYIQKTAGELKVQPRQVLATAAGDPVWRDGRVFDDAHQAAGGIRAAHARTVVRQRQRHGRPRNGNLRQGAEAAPTIAGVMANESGAYIYSASEVAREEFPTQDLTIHGEVSIGAG